MSCQSCFQEYGFFRKEFGCAHCGYSFCSKCLVKKVPVPKSGSPKPQSVCGPCYRRLREPVLEQPPPLDPEIRHRVTVDEETLSEQAIRQRLDKLKAGRPGGGGGVSQTEVEDKFAALKGCNPEHIRNPKRETWKVDGRTEAEKSRDLMSQMKQEVDMDTRLPDPDLDLECRLARLRGITEPVRKSTQTQSDDGKLLDASASGDNLESSGLASDDSATVQEIDKMLQVARLEAEREAEAAIASLQQDKDIQDRMKDIYRQTASESAKEDEIQKEMNRLWEKEPEDDEDSEEEEEKERIQKLVQQAVEQEQLERRLGDVPAPDDQSDPRDGRDRRRAELPRASSKKETPAEGLEEEALPWCSVCTEDALLTCDGCSGDLYCRRCFREGHDRQDLKTHKWRAFKKFKPKKKQTTV